MRTSAPSSIFRPVLTLVLAGSTVAAWAAATDLPLPEDLTTAQTLVGQVEATPFLSPAARREARGHLAAVQGEFHRLWDPLQAAYAKHQTDLADWQERKRRLSKRNADHGALPHQFKLPDQATASAAYQAEADRISGEMTALNLELKNLNLAWKDRYAALSQPVEAWLQGAGLEGFNEALRGLLDGRRQFHDGVSWAEQDWVRPGPADKDQVVVDPRRLITPEIYATARQDLARLTDQRQKLSAKLEEVRGWRQGLNKDYGEFEALRQEAQRDLIYEFLDHVPVSAGLKACEAKNLLTPQSLAKIEAGYAAMKGLVNEGRGISAGENPEKFQKIMEGNLELTKALQAIPKGALPEAQQKQLEAIGKIYVASVHGITGFAKGKADFASVGKVLVEIGEVAVPVAGLAVLTEHLSERGVKAWSAARAQASLGDALGSNWNAERYLGAKLDMVNTNFAEVKRQVEGYESVQAERGKAGN